MTYSLEARKARWRGQLLREAPPAPLFLVNCDPEAPPLPPLWPSHRRERVEWAWSQYARHRERAEWLRDDSFPCLAVTTGTEIFAEAFGCSVERPEDNLPYARPLISSAREVAGVRVPELGSSTLAYLFEMVDELRARAGTGTEALVKMIDIQSPMDIAALIWDKNDFYAAFIEAPEAVRELSAKVGALLTAFFDEWFRRYGTEHIAHYPHYYMPDGVTLSEDEVGVVNGEMFNAFFLPELEQLSLRYGGLGMHCCANSRHQWENFKRIPNLRLLNLIQPAEVVRIAYPFFADHCVQHHGGFDGPPAGWPAQAPAGARVVFDTYAATYDEARALSDALWTACGRE